VAKKYIRNGSGAVMGIFDFLKGGTVGSNCRYNERFRCVIKYKCCYPNNYDDSRICPYKELEEYYVGRTPSSCKYYSQRLCNANYGSCSRCPNSQ